jgi:hypothetical protein
MVSAAPDLAVTGSQAIADQYYRGLLALHENYPGQTLSVGLYDGVRNLAFVTVSPASIQSLLRGELDGYAFWQQVAWNDWDEWAERWLPGAGWSFGQMDYVGKSFGR